jgi:hypothetical protein
MQVGGVRGAQPHFVFHVANFEAGVVLGDDKGADPLVAGVRIGLGRDNDQTAVFTGGDKPLGTVDDVVVTVPDRRGLLADRIGAGLGLGKGEGTDILAHGQVFEVVLLLVFGPVVQDAFADNGIVHRHDHRGGGAGIGDFRKGQDVSHRIRIRAFVIEGHHHSHKPQAGHFF